MSIGNVLRRMKLSNWLVLAYFGLLFTSHLVLVMTWWHGLFNDWTAVVSLNDLGEAWFEGIVWHLMVMGWPFMVIWLYRKLGKT